MKIFTYFLALPLVVAASEKKKGLRALNSNKPAPKENAPCMQRCIYESTMVFGQNAAIVCHRLEGEYEGTFNDCMKAGKEIGFPELGINEGFEAVGKFCKSVCPNNPDDE